ncbi:MAG: DUF2383 domain-containing protein [Acidimicrobiia bacterium]|nr:DUF2383 domain-containing protein [Acidimicrobiia bacterium]
MRQSHIVAAGVVADTPVPALEAPAAVEAVLQTLSNGVLGYRTIAGDVSSTVLTSLFNELANKRSETVESTLRAAADAGVSFEPKTDGSVAGAIHRAWLKLESALVGDESIVDSALKAESYAINQIEEAFEGDLPDDLRKALNQATEDVQAAVQQLESWLEDKS